ncbi:MAG: aminoacyl-tRNA hydrolase [Candidatus Latescibacteria bacterium]|nr:aminoacyl-tRNA hydrolase [bacterium]MBD3425403.1 aminoacyl-tRNA hydrolase [Candidatus Latescibacterota bacterium]
MIRINSKLSIPNNEISFRFSGASKPGGQHVNRSNTRATLLFDIESSGALSESQKSRIREKLGDRINREGVLSISSQQFRSQRRNRVDAMKRFAGLIRKALERSPGRKPTRKTRSSERKRLERKKRRGRKKKLRRKIDPDGDRYNF